MPHALLYQFTTQQKSFLFSAVKPKSLRNKKTKTQTELIKKKQKQNMSFISVTGTIKWDIFVFYIVSGVIFVTVICVIVSCLFLCCPANSATYQQHLAQAKYNRPVHVPLFKFYPYLILHLS